MIRLTEVTENAEKAFGKISVDLGVKQGRAGRKTEIPGPKEKLKIGNCAQNL